MKQTKHLEPTELSADTLAAVAELVGLIRGCCASIEHDTDIAALNHHAVILGDYCNRLMELEP